MKNDNSPLIQALKGRTRPKLENALPQFEAPRAITIHHHEIPGLPGRRIGEQISVRLQGHIHSQNNDGHTVVHVSSVKPDSEGMEKEGNPDEKEPKSHIVTTQESHAP
jgi:hypothetical protein